MPYLLAGVFVLVALFVLGKAFVTTDVRALVRFLRYFVGIFLIIVDDLHLDFRNTGRIRDLFKRISRTLVHEGDMFSIVSTGPSSLAIDPTYDRKVLDEAIKKILSRRKSIFYGSIFNRNAPGSLFKEEVG